MAFDPLLFVEIFQKYRVYNKEIIKKEKMKDVWNEGKIVTRDE
jgi:hypothetical protein